MITSPRRRLTCATLLAATVLTLGSPMAVASAAPAQPTTVSYVMTSERAQTALMATAWGTSFSTSEAAAPVAAAPVLAAASKKWELIIEAVKKTGTWVLDTLRSAAKQGYDAFKRAYDNLPSPVRKLLPYAYDIYQAICAVFGC